MTDQEKAELMAAYYAKRPYIKELDDKRHALDVRLPTALDELTALDKRSSPSLRPTPMRRLKPAPFPHLEVL
jgi:hypothetical protein